MPKKPVVFVHGLWMHASSWDPWINFFNEKGYQTLNTKWPGELTTVEECRRNSAAMADHGVKDIIEKIIDQFNLLDELPIVIGHSFGGLMAQILLSNNKAAAGIAVNPAPMKGVWQFPFKAIRASLPILINPLNYKKAKSLTYSQFRYAFANTVAEEEAREIFEKWTIPTPCKPLFQAAIAPISGNETRVNIKNKNRGPLLITGSNMDNIAPPIFGKKSLLKYDASVSTDFKMFENRGHSLIAENGWRDIAEYILMWLNSKGF